MVAVGIQRDTPTPRRGSKRRIGNEQHRYNMCWFDKLMKATPSLPPDHRQRNGVCLLSHKHRVNMFDGGDRWLRGDILYHSGRELHRHRYRSISIANFTKANCPGGPGVKYHR